MMEKKNTNVVVLKRKGLAREKAIGGTLQNEKKENRKNEYKDNLEKKEIILMHVQERGKQPEPAGFPTREADGVMSSRRPCRGLQQTGVRRS